MDFSVRWLRKYIETKLDADGIAEVLTDQGLTVDEIRRDGDVVVLDIDVTTNRPDAMNYLGLARELATSGNGTMIPVPQPSFTATGPVTGDSVAVEVQAPDLCGRYVARYIRNVKIGPSPEWMQALLLEADIRPISNVVDITNYVLWELGHPLHAFDSRSLNGNRIVIRRAVSDETMVTLDGTERKLITNDLVIADGDRPVALAGIMGGENSEIREDTTDVVIESAWFYPVCIRKTSRRLAIHTDSSHRFERGADIGIALKAANRAADLIVQYAGGEVAPEPIDVYPEPWKAPEILMKAGSLKRILGLEMEIDFVTKILEGLGFVKLKENDGDTLWQVPSNRMDVTREIDLIEEVARMYGYNRMPATLPGIKSPGRVTPPVESGLDKIASVLTAGGFHEAITYSFCSPADNLAFRPDLQEMVRISNPLGENTSVMRTSILATLTSVVALNLKRGNLALKLFETGRTYLPKGKQADERLTMAAVAVKGVQHRAWNGQEIVADEFNMKGLLNRCEQKILGKLSIAYGECDSPGFNPDMSAALMLNNHTVGYLGQLSDEVLTHFGIDHTLVALELDLTDFVQEFRPTARFRPFSMMPRTERDSAFLLDRDIRYSEIESFLKNLDVPYLKNVRLFDRYEGKGVPTGKVSIAVNFVFQSDDQTLNNDEINELHQKMVAAFIDKFGAVLR
ncbi:MAG: phenylalanine--tRNA ligase subunit beta [Acidobacteria bacterium]|nr:phenylalanine--tRNA ligase subunit beta [Acidobacteriota bacterium]